MEDKQLIKFVNSALSFATTFILFGSLCYVYGKHLTYEKDMSGKEEHIVNYVPEEMKRVVCYNKALDGYYELLNAYEGLDIYYNTIEGEYLGMFFITAYCPSECGYIEYADGTDNFPCGWVTATETICYRADEEHRLTKPTTCAADSRFFHVGAEDGQTFYLPDFGRVFIAQDTGSAVLGNHLDLFYEDYGSVLNFPTGYYPTYSAEIVAHTVSGRKRMERQELIREYLKEKMNE